MNPVPLLHRLLLIAATVMSLVTIVACATDDPLPIDLAEPEQGPKIERPEDIVDLTGNGEITVEVGDNYFSPRNFIVDPGTRIVFVNVGFTPHNVISTREGAFERIPDAALDQGPVTLILEDPGDYPLFCSIHGTATFGQTGYIVVTAT
ncbi:MAG: hypothetical protein F4Z58_02635 [Acidimicrobiaceae bacterium]|nr:hypothetical protein [Acidimicrobiaceae bacterium]MXW74925.1 hypothetical protein [Acidimicrobiaceae bacterium]MYC42862.1 hypothetical protein [Acidimicrobiaceae bacterium]MYD06706.1 hypothetical protein [Acidimicrobiaceae bacterium]MYH87325.1 hypothetical protein [Acidimicrobiaceae bacterium]